MTQHELLAFVVYLRGFIEASEGDSGRGSWPTHEQLIGNLKLNTHLFGEGVLREVGDTVRTALRRHWLVVGGCSSRGSVRCHAKHYRVTDAGLEMLRLFDEQKCEHHGIKAKKRRTACARVTWPGTMLAASLSSQQTDASVAELVGPTTTS